MLKKAYRIVALVALLHFVAAAGVVGYLVATGKLTAEQAERIAEVLRGELAQPQGAQADTIEEAPPPANSAESLQRGQLREEMGRYRADRRRTELEQQAAAARAALLQVTREREALERQVASFESRQQTRKKQEESVGFKKDLSLLSSLKPKDSLYFLLQKSPEDAAKVLLLMETRKAKRIIEAARSPAQKQRMGQIMQLLGEMAPTDHELLAGAGR